jgi:hypothetical protein
MALTSQQLAAIKADILASPDLASQPANTDGDFEIARLYNLEASPAFYAWKTKLLRHDVTDKAGPSGTTFDWGTQSGNYIQRSQGERDCWREIWNTSLSCDPSSPRVREAFDNIFSGAGAGAVNNRAHILAMSRRLASRIEKLLATGTGSTASPATMGYEGPINYRDIGTARSS